MLDTTDCPPSSRAPKWCIDKADWQKFKLQSEVDETVADLPTVDSYIGILTLSRPLDVPVRPK